MANSKKLGIIQSRGLGDIVIALPIALHYHEQGYHVHWPVLEQWVEQLQHYVPWVKWIPIPQDTGAFFYEVPLQRLKNFDCTEIICLYNALTNHPEFSNEPFFQFTTFDQYKYVQAAVPFLNKWRLAECIRRDPIREQVIYDKYVTQSDYVVTHLNSSNYTVKFDDSIVPEDWQIIPITDDGWVFDWLLTLEKAQSLIMTNSVFANLVDQMSIGDDRYYIPLHHLNWSPVWGNTWTWLENPDLPAHHRTVGTPK